MNPTSVELLVSHYEEAARRLDCNYATIRAIADVESNGTPFVNLSGKVLAILKYEGHIFYNRYARKHGSVSAAMQAKWPNLIYPRWTEKWTGGQAQERRRFSMAFWLDPEVAMMSCSLGGFQIMGFNFSACGFSTVDEWWAAQHRSAEDQLFSFVNFVKSNPHMHNAVRSKDFETFAELYNGPAYAANRYHIKMASRYSLYA